MPEFPEDSEDSDYVDTPKDSKKRRRSSSSSDDHPNKRRKLNNRDDDSSRKMLRARGTLLRRGKATALGIQLVKNQLRTVNASLRDNLLSKAPPVGFGTLTEQPSRETELLDCLIELREMIVTLGFHLDIDDVTTLPTELPFKPSPEPWSFDQSPDGYHRLLDENDERVGKIALSGLVNRFSSAIFSDHHGLLIHAQVNGKPDLTIYYQSLDATHQFSGSTSVRTMGGMLPFTGPISHDTSLRGAVGFTEQLFKLKTSRPDINVIILAEAGLKEANRLIQQSIDSHWTRVTNNKLEESGANDITIIYNPTLADDYQFSVGKTDLGNAAKIVCDLNSDSRCTLLGCHILNKQAKNNLVGSYLKKKKVSALFGDTNMSTQSSSSLKFKFKTIESHTSVTDTLTFDFSNSASNKMFDKLLVRKT